MSSSICWSIRIPSCSSIVAANQYQQEQQCWIHDSAYVQWNHLPNFMSLNVWVFHGFSRVFSLPSDQNGLTSGIPESTGAAWAGYKGGSVAMDYNPF